MLFMCPGETCFPCKTVSEICGLFWCAGAQVQDINFFHNFFSTLSTYNNIDNHAGLTISVLMLICRFFSVKARKCDIRFWLM